MANEFGGVDWTREGYDRERDVHMAISSLPARQRTFCQLIISENSAKKAAKIMRLDKTTYHKMLCQIQNAFLKKHITHYLTIPRKTTEENLPEMPDEISHNTVDDHTEVWLQSRFTPEELTSRQDSARRYIGDSALAFSLSLAELCPRSSELNTALARLEEVVYWAHAAVRRGTASAQLVPKVDTKQSVINHEAAVHVPVVEEKNIEQEIKELLRDEES